MKRLKIRVESAKAEGAVQTAELLTILDTIARRIDRAKTLDRRSEQAHAEERRNHVQKI